MAEFRSRSTRTIAPVIGCVAAALLSVLLAAAASAAQRVLPDIVGGSPASITQAPWTVRIVVGDPVTGEVAICSGVIIDASHVITAAHCVAGAAPADVQVSAGVSLLAELAGAPALQVRQATAIDVDPYFEKTDEFGDDIAIVSVAPFDLSGPSVQAIALASAAPQAGQAVRLYGWGAVALGDTPDDNVYGDLQSIDETIPPIWVGCEQPATGFCAVSPVGAACRGDSGGGLVTLGPTPVLVGLDEEGSPDCTAGDPDGYTNVTMPEIREFLEGNPAPPIAPRFSPVGFLHLDEGIEGEPDAGTLSCEPDAAAWSGSPQFGYAFVDADSQNLLATGPNPDYVVPPAEAGHTIRCVVTATNAGGSVTVASNALEADALPHLALGQSGNYYHIRAVSGPGPVFLDFTGNEEKDLRVREAVQSVAVPVLRLGRYSACLRSGGEDGWLDGSVCLPLIVASGQDLIGFRILESHGRTIVRLNVKSPAVGTRVIVQWQAGRERTQHRVRLRRSVDLAVPAAATGVRRALAVSVPRIVVRNHEYLRSVVRLTVSRTARAPTPQIAGD